MSINLQTYGRFSVRIDERTVSAGSIEKPVNISIDGTSHQRVASIANASNTAMYSNELSTFNYLYLASDYNTRIVVMDTESNSFSFQLRGTGEANKYGVEFKLGLDETLNSSVTINSVHAYNTSGNTAKVICIVLK